MFVIGFLQATIQLHLLDNGAQEKNTGYWFCLHTAAYAVSSIFMSYLARIIHKPRLMLFGTFTMAISLMMIGPSPFFFQKNFAMIIIGFTFIGISSGFIFGIF